MTEGALDQGTDRRYEVRAITVLTLTTAVALLDRFMILPMLPSLSKDLDLTYEDLPIVYGATAVAWGIAALFTGRLTDRIGARSVLACSMLVFACSVGATGLATDAYSLIAIRFGIGLATGAVMAAAIAATLQAAKPTRRGMSIGIQQGLGGLLALGIAPLIVTRLLPTVDWRLLFAVLIIPALLSAYLVWRVVGNRQEPVGPAATLSDHRHALKVSLSSRNIPIAMVVMACSLYFLIVSGSLLPSYLIDHRGLTSIQMGTVLSAAGFGGVAGILLVPTLSDVIGRRPIVLLCSFLSGLAIICLQLAGPSVVLLFTSVLIMNFCFQPLLMLAVGPMSAEAVPASLVATASGLVLAFGELVGGAALPAVTGFFINKTGIAYLVPWLLGATFISFSCGLLMIESVHERTT